MDFLKLLINFKKNNLKFKQDKSSGFLKKSGMKIVNQYKRPVLNRIKKDKSAYAEMNLKRVV
ncbi:hypothetical protein BMS3Abin04_01903 [bacterium BMS3Abin04]|nr:hypothetical protein BMS3Abin04_01903 [bacterium BMS3Abin04]